MSQQTSKMQEGMRRWAGIDWGEHTHHVSVVNDARGIIGQFAVDATLEGLDTLAARLEALGPVTGVAIEATPNLIVAFLASKGYTLYSINPKLSKNWRESNSVAGVKNDARDGLVLAVELARRHESLRPLKSSEPAMAELAGLCATVRGFVDERTALVQQLKAVLRRYYPAALDFFENWTSPVAWRFLKRFPRPETLARTRKDTLYRFLKTNRIGLSPRWQQRVEDARNATVWPTAPDALVLETKMLAVVAQLQALEPHIDRCDKMIAERCRALPQARLMHSLPGAGQRLAPALTAIMALTADEDNCLQAVRCLSGLAPVQDQSGNRRHTKIRRRCNKHWRNVLHLYARTSMQCCPWARAFYDLCRQGGDTYATALRKLADKWLKIIHRMITNNELYDDQRYVEALRKNRSPVYAKLCEQQRG